MKIKKPIMFFSGIALLILIIIGYFSKINLESGSNYYIQDSLLGIIIFHNQFILGIYILIGIILITKGISLKP